MRMLAAYIVGIAAAIVIGQIAVDQIAPSLQQAADLIAGVRP